MFGLFFFSIGGVRGGRSEGKKPIIASEEQHESLLSCCPSDAKYIFDIDDSFAP